MNLAFSGAEGAHAKNFYTLFVHQKAFPVSDELGILGERGASVHVLWGKLRSAPVGHCR